MTWSTPVSELRTLLSDGPTDKQAYRKKCLNAVNGTNTRFKTFETRRVTALVGAVAPAGAYVDGILATVTSEDLESGEFTLAVAPADGSDVEATYWYKWFNDSELQSFLSMGSRWLGLGSAYTNIAEGLQPAALEYAASKAYQKLAIRWAEMLSTQYKMEDMPNPDAKAAQNPYTSLANSFLKSATSLRDDFYKRQGQSNAPLFGSALGNVRDVPPRG